MKNCRFALKKWIPVLMAGALMTVGAQSALGQSTATANATAGIASALTIVKVTDLQFGMFVSGIGGNVVVSTSGTRTSAGPIPLTLSANPVGAASFTVTGGANYVYTISLPTTISIAGPTGSTMVVNQFTTNPTATGTLSAGGTSVITVGATLQISGNQVPGAYTGTFTVTVNYQ